MAGVLASVLLFTTALPVGAFRHRALRHRGIQGATRGGEDAAEDCKAAGTALARQGPTRRVALLLRGESFRGSPLDKVYESKQYGVAKRATCYNEDSYGHQAALATGLLKDIKEMRLDGYTVDLFGATFNCVNGKDYAQKLPALYNDSFQEFTVFSDEVRKKSRQITLIQYGLDMVTKHMKQADVVYDRVYILRWDNMYRCEHFRLLDDVGMAGTGKSLSGGGNDDVVLMITAAYLPCFVEFAQLPYVTGEEHRDDRCCDVMHCGGGSCNDCVRNFLKQVYQRTLDEYVPVTSKSCPRRRSPIPAPLIPPHEEWLPESDDPVLCHPRGESPEG